MHFTPEAPTYSMHTRVRWRSLRGVLALSGVSRVCNCAGRRVLGVPAVKGSELAAVGGACCAADSAIIRLR